jgi:hypothetical protein
MPTYSFRDKNTDEVFDKFMKMSEKDQYLFDNPQFESVLTAAGVGRELTSKMKPDQGFRDVLREIKKKTNKVWTPSTINTF